MQRTKHALVLTLALGVSIPAATGWAQPLTENGTTSTTAAVTPTELWQAAWRGVLAWLDLAATTTATQPDVSGAEGGVAFGSQMDPNG